MSNYAASIEKKRALEKLQSQVKRSQGKIDKLLATVSALTKRQTTYTGFVSDALTNKNTAQGNQDYVESLLDGIEETMKKMDKVIFHTCKSNTNIKTVTKDMSSLINDLIYAVEVIDSLAQMVNKGKACNPLIPDDFVTAVTTASSDANNAVTLCLTALASCNVAMTISDQSKQITELEFHQSMDLYSVLTGMTLEEGKNKNSMAVTGQAQLQGQYKELVKPLDKKAAGEGSLLYLLCNAKDDTATAYITVLAAKRTVDKELTLAQAALENEQVQLDSLNAGLAAANAAAMAA